MDILKRNSMIQVKAYESRREKAKISAEVLSPECRGHTYKTDEVKKTLVKVCYFFVYSCISPGIE